MAYKGFDRITPRDGTGDNVGSSRRYKRKWNAAMNKSANWKTLFFFLFLPFLPFFLAFFFLTAVLFSCSPPPVCVCAVWTLILNSLLRGLVSSHACPTRCACRVQIRITRFFFSSAFPRACLRTRTTTDSRTFRSTTIKSRSSSLHKLDTSRRKYTNE